MWSQWSWKAIIVMRCAIIPSTFVTHSLWLCFGGFLIIFENFNLHHKSEQVFRFKLLALRGFFATFIAMPVEIFLVSNTFVNIWLELLISHLRTPLRFRVLLHNIQARAGHTLSFSLNNCIGNSINSDPHLEILLLNFPIYQPNIPESMLSG